eukprot:Gregarina_sp_Poly_1__9412@NODE_589_length_7363_cov_272_061129_g455_i0_p1_GENE_NODE_589_length_7363_cov_272_061129_g455_i0NODE_589_length_7363_cov_272_061129_g455_i0_p1_ORF_typecomplete_len428_score68_19Arm_2/PF04826_13/1_3e07KAP/PF05804_12/0_00012KAP/PF05804_12/45HEAT/PF02985_22/0_014HEAT/PF02985_22/1_4HEAT_2/PF13646_6/0_98HEAT_2/PF13646_6/6_5HEAT_2/PF13646_6/9e03Arm/PF00514_23/5_6Arm/PF00514_23/38Arm/PF00514_23/6_6Arm/PF00514_23/2_5e02Adaptin_N/PF01602_20/0_00022CLASP_N/PF12348_8/0_14CLASP_N/PF
MNSEDASPRTASRLNRILVKTKGLRLLRGKKSDSRLQGAEGLDLSDEQSPISASSASDSSPVSWSGLLSVESTQAGSARPAYASSSEDEHSPNSRQPLHLARDGQILDELFSLLQAPDPAVREKALATIFHLVQSSPATRDTILEAGGVQPILSEIQRDGPADAQTARALYHLCMGNPLPPFPLIAKTLPSLQRLLVTSEEEEVLVIVTYVLHELTIVDDPQSLNYIIKILPPPLHARLVALLSHESMDVRFRCLQLLGKTTAADRQHGAAGVVAHCFDTLFCMLFAASGSQCKELLNLNLLGPLRKCLGVTELQDECMEIIQNLLPNHFDVLIKSEDLIRKYFSIVRARLGLEAKVVAMLKSAVRQADDKHMAFLQQCGCDSVLEQTCRDLARMQTDMDDLLRHLALKDSPFTVASQPATILRKDK